MVEWKDAFIGAGKTVLLTICFAILGVLIIAAGTSSGITYGPLGFPRPNWIVIAPTYIIGSALILLGGMASTYKIFSEIIVQEVKAQTGGIPSTSATIGKTCSNCGTQNRPTTKFCRKCGSILQ